MCDYIVGPITHIRNLYENKTKRERWEQRCMEMASDGNQNLQEQGREWDGKWEDQYNKL